MSKIILNETGSRFLPGRSIKYLQEMHRNEENPKAAIRVLAYIMRKEGKSIYDIGKALNKSPFTVRNWLTRVTLHGLGRRYDLKKTGAPPKLTIKQFAELRQNLIDGPRSCGFESGVWTAPLLINHIRAKYGVEYTDGGIYHILQRLGFSSKTPRPKHPKSASKAKKKVFKKKAKAWIRYYSKKGHTVVACDSASWILGWNLHQGWYKKGDRVTADISLSRKRFHMFGALSEEEFFGCFYDKANGKSFCDFLDQLHKRYGKVLVFLDNAAVHKSSMTKRKLKELGGDVVLRFLPPYTPELNPAEGQWRIFRKATANVVYESTDDMQNSMVKMLKNDEVQVAKMSRYLC